MGALADATSSDAALRRFLHGLPGVDQVGAEQRAAGLGTRSIKTSAKEFAIDLAIRMVDLTTLEGADTPGKVRALSTKAMHPDPADPTCPVDGGGLRLPRHGRRSRRRRSARPAYTSRPWPPPSPAAARRWTSSWPTSKDAVDAGADEIDMVIDRGAFLSGRYMEVYEEIVAVREAVPATRTSR